MDISQYVKDENISKENLAHILKARDENVQIYAVTISVFNNEKDIGGGFFATAYNIEHLLTKNYSLAKKTYDDLRTEFTLDSFVYVKKKFEDFENQNYYLDFGLPPFKVPLLGGHDINMLWEYGKNVRLAMRSIHLPLESFRYSPELQSICYTYEDYSTMYVPVVLA